MRVNESVKTATLWCLKNLYRIIVLFAIIFYKKYAFLHILCKKRNFYQAI